MFNLGEEREKEKESVMFFFLSKIFKIFQREKFGTIIGSVKRFGEKK